jgi:hypothetical protein
MRRLAWLLLAPLAITGCWATADADDAGRFFGKTTVCPESRIVARERKDLTLVHFGCMEQARRRALEAKGEKVEHGQDSNIGTGDVMDLMCGVPAPEIKNNPGRLEIWLDIRQHGFQSFDGLSDGIFEVDGCGERRFLTCSGLMAHSDPHPSVACRDLGSVDPRRP